MKAPARLVALHEDLRRQLREEKARRAHLDLWADATSFAELCALMERFVLGELVAWPGHLGPRDPETEEIAEPLAHANRRGFLTTGSQPGIDTSTPPDYPYGWVSWMQRAAVTGFVDTETLIRLDDVVVAGTRLMLSAHKSSPRFFARSVSYADTTVVTRVAYNPHTRFGATLNRRGLVFEWEGVRGPLVDQLMGMHQVTIIDPDWGPHSLLWDRLVML